MLPLILIYSNAGFDFTTFFIDTKVIFTRHLLFVKNWLCNINYVIFLTVKCLYLKCKIFIYYIACQIRSF